MRLLDYASDIYSQNGEDGILAKIFEIIPEKDKWVVEFGAWDGKYYSNSCNLIEKYGYSAVLIEPDAARYSGLLKNHGNNPKVLTFNQFVGFTPEDNLDNILAGTPIPKEFDLLTIDIEGNDYHAWNVISVYKPKVVHIPYNPSIPTEVDFIQPADPKVNQGPSLLALTRLAERKGYQLVCINYNSAFFVQNRFFPLFGISNNDPRILREHYSGITYLFSGYDGTLFVTGRENLMHHRGIRIEKRLRQLPRFFRHYPHNFGRVQNLLYSVYWRLARMLGRA